MRVTIRNRIIIAAVIAALSLVATSILAIAQEQQQQDAKPKQDPQKGQDKKKQQNQKQQQEQNRLRQQQQVLQQQQAQQQNQNHRQQQQQAQQQEQNRRQQQQQAQQQNQNPQQQHTSERLPQQRQQQLIDQQQQRMTQYRQHVEQEVRLAPQHISQYQQQNRMAQYHFQQQYIGRMRQLQQRLLNDHKHDYYADPYFYTASIYRYNRGGIYFETNQYGANILRQAINYGYAEGFEAGQADRMDGWGFKFEDSYAYQDANYGYIGYYVDQADYNYYFREGFRRGYEDGYRNRYQYGRYDNGTHRILDGILGGILILQALR
jgi:hypothetical protein